MSDQVRTIDEYIERYANQYCEGNTELTKTHAIVQAVIREKEGDKNARQSCF